MEPNEGDVKDAIVVHCDMETKATCVLAKPEMSQEFIYQCRTRCIVWLGDEIRRGYEVGGTSLDHLTIFFPLLTWK